jgi:hypothetical protein
MQIAQREEISGEAVIHDVCATETKKACAALRRAGS